MKRRRKMALASGDKWYFTGKPCTNGHIEKRYTSNGRCVGCNETYAESSKENNKKWYQKNKALHLKNTSVWYKKNKKHKQVVAKEWRHNNYDKVKAHQDVYRERHPEKVRAAIAASRARRFRAIPKWADENKIRNIYKTARWLTETTGIIFHVDHIIPLKNKLVCGLHTQENLQIITQYQNQRKYNTFTPQ